LCLHPAASLLQLASLLRGLAVPARVLATDHTTPVQDDSQAMAQVMSEAVGVLPQKLPAVSTDVLTELVKSLGRRTRPLTQQQQQQHHHQQQQQDMAMQDLGSDSSSSLSTKEAGEAGEHESLAQLLQACVAEWSSPRRVGQITHWQAQAVLGVLEGPGLEALAAEAQQVGAGSA
jgi:hypothetical protein